MNNTIVVKDFPEIARDFLFALAFWAAAADEQLRGAEQEWFVAQFGAEQTDALMARFSAMDDATFFSTLDAAERQLNEAERRKLYPLLEGWLASCVTADGVKNSQELSVLVEIKRRLNLDDKIRRLGLRGGPQAVSRGNVFETGGLTAVESGLWMGHSGDVTAIAVSPDGAAVASGSEDGTVLLREYPSGRVLQSLGSHDMGATSVVFMPDGRKCLSGDRMGRLACHSVDTGAPVWTKHKSGRGGITGIDISSDGSLMVCCTDTGLLVVREASSGREVRVFGDKGRGAIRCVAFMPGTRNFVSGGEDGTLRLWSAENGSEAGVLKGHEGGVLCAAFGASGKIIVSGGRDNTVRMWDVQGSRCLMTLKEHSFSVYGVAVSPDGMLMASASWDHSVRIRDFKTGAARLNFVSDGGMFSCVKFHPSGKTVLAGCSDKAVHVVSLVEA